jgi:hypothetical protein
MIGHGAKLPRKRQQAIAALIEAPTIREAAGIVGIGEATLFRWLQDTDFQSAYRDAKRRVVDQAITNIQKISGQAVETLKSIMTDRDMPASTRVACAKAILGTAIKMVELENLTSRIETLEEFILKRGENHEYKKSNQGA